MFFKQHSWPSFDISVGIFGFYSGLRFEFYFLLIDFHVGSKYNVNVPII